MYNNLYSRIRCTRHDIPFANTTDLNVSSAENCVHAFHNVSRTAATLLHSSNNETSSVDSGLVERYPGNCILSYKSYHQNLGPGHLISLSFTNKRFNKKRLLESDQSATWSCETGIKRIWLIVLPVPERNDIRLTADRIYDIDNH